MDFLRLSPVEEKPFADVLSEIRLIRWLIGRSYPAMHPVAMKDGRLADVIDTQWGKYNVSCFAAVPGEALDDIDGTLDIARGYGRSLGEMHSMVKDYPWAGERRDVDALLREIRGRLMRYGAPDTMLAELDAVEKRWGRCREIGTIWGLFIMITSPTTCSMTKKRAYTA